MRRAFLPSLLLACCALPVPARRTPAAPDAPGAAEGQPAAPPVDAAECIKAHKDARTVLADAYASAKRSGEKKALNDYDALLRATRKVLDKRFPPGTAVQATATVTGLSGPKKDPATGEVTTGFILSYDPDAFPGKANEVHCETKDKALLGSLRIGGVVTVRGRLGYVLDGIPVLRDDPPRDRGIEVRLTDCVAVPAK
jgi:hypothetical protein